MHNKCILNGAPGILLAPTMGSYVFFKTTVLQHKIKTHMNIFSHFVKCITVPLTALLTPCLGASSSCDAMMGRCQTYGLLVTRIYLYQAFRWG